MSHIDLNDANDAAELEAIIQRMAASITEGVLQTVEKECCDEHLEGHAYITLTAFIEAHMEVAAQLAAYALEHIDPKHLTAATVLAFDALRPALELAVEDAHEKGTERVGFKIKRIDDAEQN